MKRMLMGSFWLKLTLAVLANPADQVTPAAIAAAVPFTDTCAAQELVARLLPGHAARFLCEAIPPENGKDVFEIQSRDSHIVLRGNNSVSIASALNWYLKYFCHCQVSWCGDQLNLPEPLPTLSQKVRRVSPHRYRYAFNYCTFGYSMAFWDWARWERELDFMALSGINSPLAATGAEVVCRNVYREQGLSPNEVDQFIAGPPFLPWFLMGNLDGWGGPNSAAWYARQEALQKKITARERGLGMTPVLPAFSGHVPAALKQKFPNASITRLKPWSGFPAVYVLDPGDPLFRKLGSQFVRESTRLFGTSHLYSADTFNEVDPPTTDPAYLKDMAQRVYQSMADADPQAVWVMQGWLFLFSKEFWTQPRIEALLSGVPDDRMLVLDLFGDGKPQWSRTQAFAGRPWLWCIINNWGGKQGMYGRLSRVGVQLPKLLGNPAAGKLSGIGTLNEGIDVNPLVFEQLYEMAWRDQPMDVAAWVKEYAWRRYGKNNPHAQQAWRILATTLYECQDARHGPQGNFLAMPPSLSAAGGGFARGEIFYRTAQVREAFRLLLEAADDLGAQDTYRFDLVDLGRQVMSDLAQQQLHAELRAAFQAADAARFNRAAAAYCEAIRDTDRLLQTHTMFQLGRYLHPARAAGTTETERARFDQNARRLITLWGGQDNPLFGYAQRQYGGLRGDYNLACWQLYLAAASQALRGSKKFDAKAADKAVRNYTETWIHRADEYPVQAQGDSVAVARQILARYCLGADRLPPPPGNANTGTSAGQVPAVDHPSPSTNGNPGLDERR
jgi:alpha-N-acetylglucosaminidase